MDVFDSASSVTHNQQFVGRHVAQLGHINPKLELTSICSYSLMLRSKAKKLIGILDTLIFNTERRGRIEPGINNAGGDSTNSHITEVVSNI